MKNRTFTATVLVILALGIGSNSMIFSVVNAILIRPLPFKDPGRLVMIWENNPQLQLGIDNFPVSASNFVDWRDQNSVFEQILAISTIKYNLTGTGDPERIGGSKVSASFFDIMGISPTQGRAFGSEEERPGFDQVVVISHSLWQRRFNSDPGVIGKALTLDDKSYTVIGIMPAGFNYPQATDLPSYLEPPVKCEVWTPLVITASDVSKRGNHNLAVMARLNPGVNVKQAQTEMTEIARRLEQQYPEDNKGFGATVLPLHEQLVGNIQPILLILFVAVGLVLLIACANVANLLLARSAAREREIAIRTALGASRKRIIRQLLTESIFLSLLGGILGIVLTILGVKSLIAIAPGTIPRLEEIYIDWKVLCFTLVISILTGLIFGLAPSLQVSKLNLNEFLKEGVKGSSGGLRSNRIRDILVVAEVSISLMLLVGAGLLIKSFTRLLEVDPGFNANNVLTMRIPLTENKYVEEHQMSAFFQQMLQRVSALPGVVSAGTVSQIPLSGEEDSRSFTIKSRPPTSIADMSLLDNRQVQGDYFSVMEIPLKQGRLFTDADDMNAPLVSIINESMARRFFADEDPIGQQIKLGGPNSRRPWLTIVGVVGDVKHSALDTEARPTLYSPYLQKPNTSMALVLRTVSSPESIAGAVRGEVWAVEKNQPVTNVKSMTQYQSDWLSQRRFSMLLFGLFAGLALVLAAVGIYGVISYSVSQRTREIGIRMALGAQYTDVLKLVIGHAMFLTFAGVVLGLVGAFALTRVIVSLLFEVSPTDLPIFVVVSLLLAVVALLASYIPARKAARLNPVMALRQE